MILEYNKYMNGVDKCDQYLTYYSLGRKARKWWEKVFFRLCELWIINAMVLYFAAYPDFAKQCQAHKLFRVQLAHELVQPLLDAKAAVGNNVHSPVPGRRSIEDDVRLQGKHFAESRHPKRGRYASCGYKKGKDNKYKDTKTSNYCTKCDKFICKSCFKLYHTKSYV